MPVLSGEVPKPQLAGLQAELLFNGFGRIGWAVLHPVISETR